MAKAVKTREKCAAIYFELFVYPCSKGCEHPWVKTSVTDYFKHREMNVISGTWVNSNTHKTVHSIVVLAHIEPLN